MNWTADEIEKAADHLFSNTPECKMLRAFAAERRMIEGPNEAIDAMVLRHIEVAAQEHVGGPFVQGLVLELFNIARTLAAALEQERKECEAERNHRISADNYISQLRDEITVLEDEAVKLRDSELADETINAVTRADAIQIGQDKERDGFESHGGDAKHIPAESSLPAVAAPDQEGLDEAISHLTHVRDLVKDTQPKWANSLTTVLAALRNSAKPAAEIPGWQPVPKQPTKEMLDAIPWPTNVTPRLGVDCYTAMLAAAPSPPSNNRSET